MTKIKLFGTEGFKPSIKVCSGCKRFLRGNKEFKCLKHGVQIFYINICYNPEFYTQITDFKQEKKKKIILKQKKLNKFIGVD